MSEMYNRIEDLCKSRGINITQMCKDTSVSRGNLTDLKMGRQKSLSAQNTERIASYFGVSVGYLLTGEQKETPTVNGERTIGGDILDEVDVAFYGEYKELTDDDQETVRNMVRIMRERRSRKQE